MHDSFLAGYMVGASLVLLIFAYVIYEQEIKRFGKRWLAHELEFFREYQKTA